MYLDTRYRVHLEWMFENQPSLVLKLLRTNKLKDHLDDKEQRALKLVMQLRDNRGMTEDEAFEVACQTILAAPDGPAMSDHPPKPLDWRQREAVYKKPEEMGDEEDMWEKEDFQKRHGLI
jgi:hypothetical protein